MRSGFHFATTITLALALLASGCAPVTDEETDGDNGASNQPEVPGAPEAANDESQEAIEFSETGWRVIGDDGAVYTTFLDADGTYRDRKNGEPLQRGNWDRREGKLCYTPEEEDRAGECWEHDKLEKDGTMRATSDSGKTIELRRVTYIAPATGG